MSANNLQNLVISVLTKLRSYICQWGRNRPHKCRPDAPAKNLREEQKSPLSYIKSVLHKIYSFSYPRG